MKHVLFNVKMRIILNCILLVLIMNLASDSLGRKAKRRHKQSIIHDTDMESKLGVDSLQSVVRNSKFEVLINQL